MRALSGFVFCACAAATTMFSPIQEERFDRPVSVASPPRPPEAPASIGTFRGPAPVALPGQSTRSFFYRDLRTGSNKEERKLNGRITDLQRKLNSDDAETRATAEEELEVAVAELFDMRTKTRKTQIEDLEKRLATLRKQLEKREDNKSEIVRLHVKTMVNEAKGLGF